MIHIAKRDGYQTSISSDKQRQLKLDVHPIHIFKCSIEHNNRTRDLNN
jgi:hypothetical protein